jgi:hypothetical protein
MDNDRPLYEMIDQELNCRKESWLDEYHCGNVSESSLLAFSEEWDLVPEVSRDGAVCELAGLPILLKFIANDSLN